MWNASWIQPDEVRFSIFSLPARPVAGDLADDVRQGLGSRPKVLPPKYFYDAHGSELFERICLTPEYYPTRTEDALLARSAGAIIDLARPTLEP